MRYKKRERLKSRTLHKKRTGLIQFTHYKNERMNKIVGVTITYALLKCTLERYLRVCYKKTRLYKILTLKNRIRKKTFAL